MVDSRPPPWTGYNAGQDPTPRLLLLARDAPWTLRAQQCVFEASIREQRTGSQADGSFQLREGNLRDQQGERPVLPPRSPAVWHGTTPRRRVWSRRERRVVGRKAGHQAVNDTSLREQTLVARTKATRDRHRLCRIHLLPRSPESTRRARDPRLLRHTSTEPEQTRIGKVEPTHGNHLDHGVGGDIATACRHEAPCAHESRPSLDVADRRVGPPRFGPGISTDPGGFTTGDLGVSPDRTRTGWLS